MSRKKKGLQLLVGLVAAGTMSMTAVAQDCNSCAGGSVYESAVASCGCQGGCQGGCGGSNLGSRLSGLNIGSRLSGMNTCRCEGDAFKLFGRNCEDPWLNVGGWFQAGYHDESNGLFNNQPGDLNLHQGWLFAEKAAQSRNGGLGFGFRFDGMYGIDAGDTQAFGNPGPTWDLAPGFQRGGGYGWAIPQAYGEVAVGDLSVKVGHFFTLVGYEVVTAPDNFFYSHAMTMYNSEPFTHTGAIATYNMNDNMTVYGGWTAGWDSGFDFAAGSNFLGGFSRQINDDVSLTYITTFGNFGTRSAGNDDGYSHSFVLDMTMTENWNTVVQSDLTRIASTGEDSVGLMLYNFYTINSCLSVGSRAEWWKGDDLIGYDYGGRSLAPTGSTSYYSATYGANIRVNPNVVLRPEYRMDHSPGLDYDENYFAFDMVATF
jgi:hypothetical protein